MGFEEGTKGQVPLLASTIIFTTMRLHQSNQGHSMACLAFIVCKYQVPYIIPGCNLQRMIMYVQYILYSAILCEWIGDFSQV
jgi:hypothetical protein